MKPPNRSLDRCLKTMTSLWMAEQHVTTRLLARHGSRCLGGTCCCDNPLRDSDRDNVCTEYCSAGSQVRGWDGSSAPDGVSRRTKPFDGGSPRRLGLALSRSGRGCQAAFLTSRAAGPDSPSCAAKRRRSWMCPTPYLPLAVGFPSIHPGAQSPGGAAGVVERQSAPLGRLPRLSARIARGPPCAAELVQTLSVHRRTAVQAHRALADDLVADTG